MSLTTKRALADSFEKLLSKRSFDKITVKDIVEDCGVNRQTFYYHFHDIYDLIEWIFQDAADNVDSESLDYDDWTSGLESLLKFLQDNRMLILNAYNSISHVVVANYIKKGLHPYCAAIVRRQADDMKTENTQENIDFVTDILTLSASGLVINWIGQQMRSGEDTMRSMRQLKIAMNGSIQLMLRNLSENQQPGLCREF
ncbi:MAG: TetR/AcrR family transcriptional regulator C-terminal domain-containing protein [Oscillibacter sp.]|jgi:probable dihydroxyacetone kinase regulator|nr:TetR/AcrR family transcriptional regulator C-terminal domain-containing protein [Oscillibacter sp.]